MRTIAGFLIAAGAALGAQEPAQRPAFDAFEVATIKPTGPDVQGRWIRMQTAHQFQARNHSVLTLIAAAYNLNLRAISGGPAWVESDRYDILARTPGEVRPNLDEQMRMLRQLLNERFHLTFHREHKELPIYALKVAKGGPKLKETVVVPGGPEGPPPLVFVVSPDAITLPGRYASMAEFASVFQRAALGRPVVDQTGLTGRYDFDLQFSPDESLFGGMLKAPEVPTKPDLFAAVQQQLGLKLEATRGPVETLVIDRAERPSEN